MIELKTPLELKGTHSKQVYELVESVDKTLHAVLDTITKNLSDEDDYDVRTQLQKQFSFWG